MELKRQLLEWYNNQLEQKNIFIHAPQQLSTGYYFLQLLHNFHPKAVDLSKIYIKPKNQYEVLQNYKILSSSFAKLGWKKFDPERYSKRKEKDYLSLAQVLRKILSRRSMKESCLHDNIDATLQQFRGQEQIRQKDVDNQKRHLRIVQLQQVKKQLLSQIIRVQEEISKEEKGEQGQLIEVLRSRINQILGSSEQLH